jgi:hypothetical protein
VSADALGHDALDRAPNGVVTSATRYQDAIDFQAGGPDGSPRVLSAAGRWEAAVAAAVSAGRSAAKMPWKASVLM